MRRCDLSELGRLELDSCKGRSICGAAPDVHAIEQVSKGPKGKEGGSHAVLALLKICLQGSTRSFCAFMCMYK